MKRSVAVLMITIMVLVFGAVIVFAAPTPAPNEKKSSTPAVSSSPSPSVSVSPSASTQTNEDNKTNDETNALVQGADVTANSYIDEMNAGFFGQSKRITHGNTEKYFSDWNGKYYIDFKKGGFLDVTSYTGDPMANIVNLLFILQKYAVELLIKFMDLAFDKNTSFTWLFNGTMNNMIGDLYSKVFKVIIGIAIALIGFYIAWNLIRNDKSKIFQILVKTVLIVAAAEYFYTHPIEIMEKVDNAVNDTSLVIMSSMYNNTSDENKAVVNSENDLPLQKAANALFEQYVHKPWQIVEFGSEKTAEENNNQAKILDAPSEKQRERNYKELQEKHKFTDSSTKRLCFQLVYMIPIVVNLLVLAFLTFLTIAYKFYLLFVIFLGIFIFPLSFVPSIGPNIIKEWGMKVVGVACMKIVVSIFFILILQFNQTILSQMSTKNWSWITLLFIQAVIYTVIFVKRNVIKNLLDRTKRAMAKPRMAGHYMQGYMDNIGKELSVKGTAAEVKDAAITAQEFTKKSGRITKKSVTLAEDAAIGLGKTGVFGPEVQTASTIAGWGKRAKRYEEEKEKEQKGKSSGSSSNSNSNSSGFVNSGTDGRNSRNERAKTGTYKDTGKGIDVTFDGKEDKTYHYTNPDSIAYVKDVYTLRRGGNVYASRRGGRKRHYRKKGGKKNEN